MCVMSMVYDHYNPIIPDRLIPLTPGPPLPWEAPSPEDVRRTEKLIDDFLKARDAAKIVDALTKQPNCEDPEKKKLEERVAQLEKEIAEIRAAQAQARLTPTPKRYKGKIVAKAELADSYKKNKGKKKR